MTSLRRTTDKEFLRIEATAADWLARRGDTSCSAQDDSAFYAWLESDPRHGEAYDELARALEDVGQLRHLPEECDIRRPVWRSRLAPALGMACAALLVLVLASPSLTSGAERRFETEIGQTRLVSLGDGSTVTLGADSEIRVRFADNERRVTLESGEAFFEVARNERRPFFVEAAGTIVRVVGTTFDVHRGAESVRVSVQEGRVEVRDARAVTLAPAAVRVLGAGQRTEVQNRPAYISLASVPPPVEPVTFAPPGAWRQGRLAYDDARLADVVADINRYYAPGVRLNSPETSELRVTASFRVNEIPAFLDALSATLPVSVAREPTGAFALEKTP